MALKGPKINTSDSLNIDSVVNFILTLQRESGDIPWHMDGKTDPWDLIETAMGLNIGKRFEASFRAFEWLKNMQNPDGSWYSSYIDGKPEDLTCETHMAAYISVGLFHTWLMNKDTTFLEHMWPTMEKGINYGISLQTKTGEIYWAKSPKGIVDPMSLLAGSSSIFMSLKCALAIAGILGKHKITWETAFDKLGKSIRENIHNYNVSKSRFSMYWFYPVLSGALTGEKAEHRIEKYWKKYVIEGQGVRCVSDQPWVTIAETCELVLALYGMGRVEKAGIVFSWIQDRIYEDRTYWCGYTYPDMVIWPEEKISWTNAVVLMAADALYALTPASGLFNHRSWDGFTYTDLIN
ncbi:MAG: phenyltransferase domain-containing protein [Proteobacteria bacterium]|nr:phenyltransferase domain-containing protein [Pseudomonadota bacterium]MBU1583971.1 phenyltransferase domain-containing protein [Pseudomonadota bacterium]MBU2453747.1 phenyltransferase domain-containing protein [Pseudomonadota bacterium]MBU2631337.1 phenyltransferase domain-containing protein [Pseudomonadota bacterium]